MRKQISIPAGITHAEARDFACEDPMYFLFTHKSEAGLLKPPKCHVESVRPSGVFLDYPS